MARRDRLKMHHISLCSNSSICVVFLYALQMGQGKTRMLAGTRFAIVHYAIGYAGFTRETRLECLGD